MYQLSEHQNQIINYPINNYISLEGPAGTGKTIVGINRLARLLQEGVSPREILILAPHRFITGAYQRGIREVSVPAAELVQYATIAGLAKRAVDLYWPLIAQPAGYKNSHLPPRFLTAETAQYYLIGIVRQAYDQGAFSSIQMPKSRVCSQILDALNKSAVMGFPYTEIGQRLTTSWVGDQGQRNAFADVQRCADAFRKLCLENNLLDLSLTLETFVRYGLAIDLVRERTIGGFSALIYDNIEEDSPVGHDIAGMISEQCSSVLMIQDRDAGYRRFLGADPDSAKELVQACCDQVFHLEDSLITSPAIEYLRSHLSYAISPQNSAPKVVPEPLGSELINEALSIPDPKERQGLRFHTDAIDWTVSQVERLVSEGVPPQEIAILSPFLSDALRFALSTGLTNAGIPWRSSRPSRSLMDEPAVSALMILAELSYPEWTDRPPLKEDVAKALSRSIDSLDLIRARHLTDIIYRPGKPSFSLFPFDGIVPKEQARVTYQAGNRYTELRRWLVEFQGLPDKDNLDRFFSAIFDDVLSKAGFGFHKDRDAGCAVSYLIESARKFRWEEEESRGIENGPWGRDFLEMMRGKMLAAQYLVDTEESLDENAVLLVPAHTFLTWNKSVTYQFWLAVESPNWINRLLQPLTHPYVLSRRWPSDQIWSVANEEETNRDTLRRLTTGLLRRCRHKVFMVYSELGASGREERGALLKALQRTLNVTSPQSEER